MLTGGTAITEELGLDADNLVILSEQLKCAAFELPFRAEGARGQETVSGFGSSLPASISRSSWRMSIATKRTLA